MMLRIPSPRWFVRASGMAIALPAIVLGMALAGSAAAAVEICLAIDGSGSIAPGDFALQIEGIARAVEDPVVVPRDGSVTLSVVQFNGGAVVEAGPTTIDSAATAATFVAQVRAITQNGDGTDMKAGIDTCVATGLRFAAGQKVVIDVSTDGFPNDPAGTLAAADAAVAAGVDAINALGVGPGASEAFLDQLVRPQPAKEPPADGFVVLIDDFAEYEAAVKAKILAEVGEVIAAPAMAMWGMLILGGTLAVGGLRKVTRRRS